MKVNTKKILTILVLLGSVVGLDTVQATAATSATSSWWVPTASQPIEWQWELDHALNRSSSTDMGYGDTTASAAPAANPTVYDIDGIDNPASTVSALHSLGDKAVCYIEVGTAGNYYSASEEGVLTTYYAQLKSAGDLGRKLSGYPEYFININASSAVSIIENMIDLQCGAKGFDGVETDLDETFNNNEGKTGFTITESNEVSYLQTLANYMHSLGLAWFAKDTDDLGSPSFSNDVEPFADAVITEQCNEYGTCSDLGNFIGNKAIFNAEYTCGGNSQCTTVTKAETDFCAYDNANGFNGVLFDINLDGKVRVPCR